MNIGQWAKVFHWTKGNKNRMITMKQVTKEDIEKLVRLVETYIPKREKRVCYNLVDPLATIEKLIEEDLTALRFFRRDVCHDKVEMLRETVKDFNSLKSQMGLGNQWIEEAYYSDLEEEFIPMVAKMCKIRNFLHISQTKEDPKELFEFSTGTTITKSVELNFEYNGMNLNV